MASSFLAGTSAAPSMTSWSESWGKCTSSFPTSAYIAYGGALAISWFIFELVAEREWTSVATLSVVAHFLGVVMLCVQVVSSSSGVGVSARALMLDAIALAFRLSSTLNFWGYLPSDASADYLHPICDMCSFALICYLLNKVLRTHRDTYQEDEDGMRLGPLVAVCCFLGILLHGDLDENFFADSFWMSGLFISVVQVLPQYWLILQSGGRMQALTAHYIAATALERILSGMFMWHSRAYITCAPWVGNFQHAIYAILLAHIIHLAILSDFAYHYFRTVLPNLGRSAINLQVDHTVYI